MGMNKGKLKRAKRELEKLFSQGRYWEFLEEADAGDMGDLFPKESERAWRELTRQAFGAPEMMLDFVSKAKRLKTPPDTPDIRFLLLLERFVNGDDVTKDLESAGNLSPMPLMIKKRLLLWNDSLSEGSRTGKLFDLFLTKPDRVTKKSFLELLNLSPDFTGAHIDFLPESFETLRKFNLKSAVKKKQKGVLLHRLAEIDEELKEIGHVCPESIFRIILAPILLQVSLLYENYGHENGFALTMCETMPFLTKQLTGARWQELETILLESNRLDYYETDRQFIKKKLSSAGFPEKVKLLRQVAHSLNELEKRERDRDDFDDFDDFDDSEELDDKRKKAILDDYLLLYRDVLTEIGGKRATISQRDQRELTQVMGGILEKDLDSFLGNPHYCLAFLKAIGQSGCMNTKFAIAALFISRHEEERELREHAEKALTALPSPNEDDVRWFLDHFHFLCYPEISCLYPVIQLVKNDERLITLIAERVIGEVRRALVDNFMKMNLKNSMLGFLADGFSRADAKSDMTRFRKGLANFKEIAGFSPLFELAETFPDGYITEAGHKKNLFEIYSRSGIESIIRELEIIHESMRNMPDFAFGVAIETGVDKLIKIQTDGVMELLRDHCEDLRSASPGSISTLVMCLGDLTLTPELSRLLIRISNILQERKDAGEKEIAPLAKKLSDMIIKAGKPKNKRGTKR